VKGSSFAEIFNSDYTQLWVIGGEILKSTSVCHQRKKKKWWFFAKEGFTKLTAEKSGEKIHLHPLWNKRKTGEIGDLKW